MRIWAIRLAMLPFLSAGMAYFKAPAKRPVRAVEQMLERLRPELQAERLAAPTLTSPGLRSLSRRSPTHLGPKRPSSPRAGAVQPAIASKLRACDLVTGGASETSAPRGRHGIPSICCGGDQRPVQFSKFTDPTRDAIGAWIITGADREARCFRGRVRKAPHLSTRNTAEWCSWRGNTRRDPATTGRTPARTRRRCLPSAQESSSRPVLLAHQVESQALPGGRGPLRSRMRDQTEV